MLKKWKVRWQHEWLFIKKVYILLYYYGLCFVVRKDMKYILIPLLLAGILSEALGLLARFPVVVFVYGVINAITWVEGVCYIIFNIIIEKNTFTIRVKKLFKICLFWFLMFVIGVFVMAFYDVTFNKFEWIFLVLLSSWLWDEVKGVLDRKSKNN